MRRSFSSSRPRLPSTDGRRSVAASGRPSLRSFSRVASEPSFLPHGGRAAAGSAGTEYLTHDDINRKAIQILHTEGPPSLLDEPGRCSPEAMTRIIHPYDRFRCVPDDRRLLSFGRQPLRSLTLFARTPRRTRRVFDLATVIWVLLLVFFLPLEIGFDWYNVPSGQKIFFSCLDFWFGERVCGLKSEPPSPLADVISLTSSQRSTSCSIFARVTARSARSSWTRRKSPPTTFRRGS